MDKFEQIADRIGEETRVMDFGCGIGPLAPHLTLKRCILDGIDIDPDALDSARKSYRRVQAGDLETFDFDHWEQRYDVVVFSDVLEHLRCPERVLKESQKLLDAGGKVVISLPNVAYWTNRLSLLRGQWEYQDTGILDRTHLKFFTLETAETLIREAGLIPTHPISEIPIIASPWKRKLFDGLANRWPSVFAIGWVFEARPNHS